MNREVMAGVLTGVIIGLLIVVLMLKLANKNGKLQTEYDERQKNIRGQGYRYSFFTVTVILGIMALLDIGEIKMPVAASVQYFFVIACGICVHAVYCIMNDGYWGLNNKKGTYQIIFWVIAGFNAVIATTSFGANRLIIDGKLDYPAMNLLCTVIFAILGAAMVIKDRKDKSCDDDEEKE